MTRTAHPSATVQQLRRSFTEPLGWQFDKLRQVHGRDLVVRFAFGFAVSVFAGVVTLAAGDRVGGLFLAFPAILPASLTLISRREGRREAEVDAAGAVLGALALISFAVVSWQAGATVPIGIGLAAAALAWLVTSSILYFIVRSLTRRRSA